MDELGPPVAYTAVTEGTPVYQRHGERIGEVAHVVADEPVDVFHGLIVHTRPVPGRDLYAPAEQIAGMHERGVRLSVDRGDLHEIDEDPAARTVEDRMDQNPPWPGLRRAWHWGGGR
jgi:uncharacterized protein YrrD